MSLYYEKLDFCRKFGVFHKISFPKKLFKTVISLTTIYNANSSYSDSISAAVIGDLDQFANCTNEIEIGKSCSKLEDVSDEKNLQKLIPDMIDEDVTHFNDKYILAFEVSENETTTKFKELLYK